MRLACLSASPRHTPAPPHPSPKLLATLLATLLGSMTFNVVSISKHPVKISSLVFLQKCGQVDGPLVPLAHGPSLGLHSDAGCAPVICFLASRMTGHDWWGATTLRAVTDPSVACAPRLPRVWIPARCLTSFVTLCSFLSLSVPHVPVRNTGI